MSGFPVVARVSKADRAGALDALRFLAAAFVVLYHFGSSAPVDLTERYTMLDRGWLATDFIIIVSGFVLGRAYGVALDTLDLSPHRFVLKRLLRVWPAHLIVLSGLAGLLLVAHLVGLPSNSPERFQASDFIYQALLVHAWGVSHQPSWNEPSWTLSALIVCYALFPLVWLASRRLSGRGSALIVGFGLVIAAGTGAHYLLHASLFDLPFHQGVVRTLPLFILGAMLARFAQGREVSPAMAVASGLASLIALVVIQVPARTEFSAVASIVALATLIVSADSLGVRQTPLIKAAASIAFTLFITHAVIGTVWFSGLDALNIPTSWLTWFGAWVAVFSGATAFHLLIDRPIQTWLRAWTDRLGRPVTQPKAEALTA